MPRKEIFKMVFFFGILFATGFILASLPQLTIPLAFAYVIFLLVDPAVPALVKFGFSRGASYGVLLASIIFFFAYPLFHLVPVVVNEVDKIQIYLPLAEEFVSALFIKIKSFVLDKFGWEIDNNIIAGPLSEIRGAVQSFLLNIPKILLKDVLGSFFLWIIIIPLFLFFMLRDGKRFKRSVLDLVPNILFEKFYFLTHQFNKQLGDYIFAKFVEASIIGSIVAVGLLLLDVKFPILLGFIAAITNVIPYLGPFIGTIPGILLVAVQQGFDEQFWPVVILYLVANLIDFAIVFPLLVSKIVKLHPIIVVVSVILGGHFFGVAGMIVSIPCAAAAKLIFTEVFSEFYSRRYL